MKALNKLFIAAIATLAMSACNNELGEQQVNSNGIINFRMGIGTPASSRTAMDDDKYSATFTEGDEVGIFVKEEGSYTNVKYSTEDGSNWTGGPIKAPAEGEFSYTFYAYYPYNENNSDASSIKATVETDQETSGYIKNDFLISTATTSNETVNLPFNHALSLVEVKLTGDGAAEGATVSILGVATDATIDLTTSTVTTGTTKADVTMDALTGVAMKYRAIVPSQEIAANTPIFKIEVNGKTYNASFDSNVKFEQGKYLAMIITLGKEEGPAEIEITTGATINDWTEGDGGDVSVEEEPIILPLGDALTEVINNPTSLTEDTWFGLKQAATTSGVEYSIEEDASTGWGKAAKLSYTSTWNSETEKAVNNSWYIGTLGYYHCSANAINGGIYKVTMKIKGDTNDGGTISKLVITCRNADNTSSFGASTSQSFPATTVSVTPKTAKAWEDYVFYINFDKKSTTVGTVPTTNIDEGQSNYEKRWIDSEASDYSKIDLRIYTNDAATSTTTSNTATIYISDVKMEPYVAE